MNIITVLGIGVIATLYISITALLIAMSNASLIEGLI